MRLSARGRVTTASFPTLAPPPSSTCRGTPWCSVHPIGGTEMRPGSNCSRESLSILSEQHPALLNVSINRPYGAAPGKEGPPATHLEHARYK